MNPENTPEDATQASGRLDGAESDDGEARVCAYGPCEETFAPYRDWQLYHDDSCRKAAWREGRTDKVKQEVVDKVVERVREDVVRAVEEAFENLSL